MSDNHQIDGLYIDGKFESGENGSFDVINPFNEEVLLQATKASPSQVNKAIDSSYDAMRMWAKLDSWQRGDVIKNIAVMLSKNIDDIAKTITLETGKPISQAQREVNLSIDQFIWYSESCKRIKGEIIESRFDNTTSYVTYESVGVVASFSSWNFPFLLIARKLAPALAAGCASVCRASSNAPISALKMAKVTKEAGLLNGMFNVVSGDTKDITPTIMENKKVKKVSLTGSTNVGRELIKQSSITIKKITMELGGNAPVIVYDDVNVGSVAKMCVAVKFANAGQVCVSPTRFFVHSSIIDEFCSIFVDESKKIKLGFGLDKDTTMGPLINKDRLESVERFIQYAKDENASILTGGNRPSEFKSGYFFNPTVIRDLKKGSKLLCEEMFGPIALINSFSSDDEAIERANETEHGLASYIFTRSAKRIKEVPPRIEAGMVGVNSFALAQAEVPFGGVKQSGYGRESGEDGMYEYLVKKSITVNVNI